MSTDSQISVVGVASATNRQDEAKNEDFVGVASNADCEIRAALVADGLCREVVRKHVRNHQLVASQALLDELAEKAGWTVVSMKNDWKQVFPE